MANAGMIAETISIDGDRNEPISACVARPLGAGPFPGIVLIHHAPGWVGRYREPTRKFADHGYAAISHNLYHRTGDGKPDDVAARVRAQPWLDGKAAAPGTASSTMTGRCIASNRPLTVGQRSSCSCRRTWPLNRKKPWTPMHQRGKTPLNTSKPLCQRTVHILLRQCHDLPDYDRE